MVIEGKVQGVGFRYFTKQRAKELGLNGRVKNLSTGQVEAVFGGDEEKVLAMLDWCEEGPPLAQVRNVEIYDYEGTIFPGFVVEA